MMLLIIILLFSITFYSCIEEYSLPSSAFTNYKSEVVIQGRILRGGETIIYMTQTQPMGTVLKQETQIEDAKIKVIGYLFMNQTLRIYIQPIMMQHAT